MNQTMTRRVRSRMALGAIVAAATVAIAACCPPPAGPGGTTTTLPDPVCEALPGSTTVGDVTLTVSQATCLESGDVVTVTGTGYDAPNIATRPPVGAGNEAGVYVVFGKFADVWQPSQSPTGTPRQIIHQMWALPQASLTIVTSPPWNQDPASFSVLNPDGSFELQLTITETELSNPNFGVASYVAGGAPNRVEQELFVPISFAAPAV